ncbi:xanthine dehydrogenase family protein molybdopterin-binding subunit [Polaribacter tangerinus]|uniref:xanthine dehydrogenase family protein molybdopterin-binding subunit n=1 Tax=Polaribacter tangerinus TaxID=1920034 RepID=UPI000B4BEEF5|nr:molybdopterin cofactor-binding domain-containing protein [Polaribacter tangerinus]
MKLQTTTNFSRRNFLKTSFLASGGLLIGFNLLTACKDTAVMPVDISQLNFNDFNAFIKISDEGYITIYSPNPEIGQGVKTSMPMIIAEELEADWSKVTVAQGILDTNNYTRQVAGGSQSIRSSYTALRQTGATAKQMLVNAAALKWQVPAETLSVSKGIITNKNGDTFHYGNLVKEASVLEIPENVRLKNEEDFTIIGTDKINVDIDKIVTGKHLFGIDYKAPEMLYASVLRPPAFGNSLISYDAEETKKIKGVVKVISFGDKIAVLATSTWIAMKGKKALAAKWKTSPKLESTEKHHTVLTDILNSKKLAVRREDGNVEKAFKNADIVVERTYSAPFLPHNCMEPMNFFAHVTDQKIHLVGPIQTPAWTANRVAKLLDRKLEDIHLEMTRMGGGFGRRLYGDFALEAAEIANIVQKPVQVLYSREDDMTAGTYRPATKYRIKAALKDGKITGYHLKEAAINGNMYGTIPNFFPAGCIPNYKVETGSYTSNITTGAWRAPYTNFLAFAEQSFFDELAKTLKKDAIELRLELLQKVKNTSDKRIEYSGERMEKTIQLVREKGNWGTTNPGTYQGFAAYYSHNTHVAEIAEIALENGFPVIKKVTVAVDCGVVVNPTGAKNQIEGGVLDGIGHAMFSDFSFENGKPTHKNFDTYRLIRMKETPKVEVYFVPSKLAPTGLGEPGLPPAGAAVANAIHAALGKRMYAQPFVKELAS